MTALDKLDRSWLLDKLDGSFLPKTLHEVPPSRFGGAPVNVEPHQQHSQLLQINRQLRYAVELLHDSVELLNFCMTVSKD